MKNYANVLAIIMRLRQLCCHPKLCAKAVKKLQKAMDMMDQLRDQMAGEYSMFEIRILMVEEYLSVALRNRPKIMKSLKSTNLQLIGFFVPKKPIICKIVDSVHSSVNFILETVPNLMLKNHSSSVIILSYFEHW